MFYRFILFKLKLVTVFLPNTGKVMPKHEIASTSKLPRNKIRNKKRFRKKEY